MSEKILSNGLKRRNFRLGQHYLSKSKLFKTCSAKIHLFWMHYVRANESPKFEFGTLNVHLFYLFYNFFAQDLNPLPGMREAAQPLMPLEAVLEAGVLSF